MSDTTTRLRIRVQHSPLDPDTLCFLLDAPIQREGGIFCFEGPDESAPLAVALFAVPGVRRLEVAGPAIHVYKTTAARWDDMKAPIAAAIRAAMGSSQAPLGNRALAEASDGDADARMLAKVRVLLDDRINPSIASHGGQISAERVTDRTVYLRMSGGCQGCAASQLTLTRRGRTDVAVGIARRARHRRCDRSRRRIEAFLQRAPGCIFGLELAS